MAYPRTSTKRPIRAEENEEKRAFRRALALFREASLRVPAYKDFLKKSKIKPYNIKSPADFAQVPLTDKTNYVSKYNVEQLSWDGSLEYTKYISSSSGSTGIPFNWPRGRKQDIAVAAMFRRIYEVVFGTRSGSTLCVDSFALGTWIAGLEFYNATKWTADVGSNIVLVTPGIDKTVAVDQIKQLASSFDRIVIGGYPPFVKDILEHGAVEGLQWRKYDVRLLTGGEAVSERWRDRVLELIGKSDPYTSILNMYGMAETGIVGFESPLSIAIRRSVDSSPDLQKLFYSFGELSALYQYDPLVRFFEQINDDQLILTTDAGIPLVRYDTRDTGGIMGCTSMLEHTGEILRGRIKSNSTFVKNWRFPFVYLRGRRDLSISLYALNIYVENVKHALEGSRLSNHLSGLFTMSVDHTATMDQQFSITIELARGTEPSAGLKEELTTEILKSLCALNSEYAKLFSVIGERAKPQITLLKYGEIQTVPGRKHKWIKRS